MYTVSLNKQASRATWEAAFLLVVVLINVK